MQGYYKNAYRENYCLNIKGPDFIVEGLGKFKNITHVEIKNPVSSSVKVVNKQKKNVSQ